MGSYVSAAQVVRALKGRWTRGHHGTCCCPAHNDKTPSLSVSETRDGRVLVKCFAGCSQEAVIAALIARGLWNGKDFTTDPSYFGAATTHYDGVDHKTQRARRSAALDLWDKGRSAKGTLAEAYLRSRGIKLPVSDQLRFVSSLRHTEAQRDFPAMLARISDDRGFCAIQRTYLDPDGGKAKVEVAKKTMGPMVAGAVRLRIPTGDMLGIAEGIETSLSASQIYAMPVWAALSAHRLSKIDIPPIIKILTIFADAGDVGGREAFSAQDYYESKGYHVEVIRPAAHFTGNASDFNDVLGAQGVRAD